jgi:hypothetical protein
VHLILDVVVRSKLDMIMVIEYYTMDDIVDLLVENYVHIVSSKAALAMTIPHSLVGVSHRDALQACAKSCLLIARPCGGENPP